MSTRIQLAIAFLAITFYCSATHKLSAVPIIAPAPGFTITWDGNDGDHFDPVAPPTGALVPDNVALHTDSASVGTSAFPAAAHTIGHINDGFYGNSNSWIANPGDASPSIGVAFQRTYSLNSIAWGRDNGNGAVDDSFAGTDGCGGQCSDRFAGTYTLQFTRASNPSTALFTGNPLTGWSTIGTVTYDGTVPDAVVGGSFTPYLRHEYAISEGGAPLVATGVRIAASPNDIAIDEIELGAAPAPIPQAGLSTHLRADLGVRADTSNFVSQWLDQANNNHAGQSVAAAQPTYVDNAINNLPGIKFDGVNDFLDFVTAPSDMGIQNSDYTMFIVSQSDDDGIRFLTGGAVPNFEVHLNGSSGARFIPNGFGSAADASDMGAIGEFSDGGAHIFEVRLDVSEGFAGLLSVDGISSMDLTNGDDRSAANTPLRLGSRIGAGSFYFDGYIAEVLIYDRELTDLERNMVGVYLENRYGLETAYVPEPGTLTLGMLGVIALCFGARRIRAVTVEHRS